MALVIVLALLVLLTILVVGFFSRATADRATASAYFESGRNSILADQAVGIVQAQIDHASTQKKIAWASQPGMVRTFNSNGNLRHAYKLYSDADMIADSANVGTALAALQGWRNSSAHYVDLNEPVSGAQGSVYPIIDPSALGIVEGFEVNNAPGATTGQPIPMPVKWLYILEDGTAVAPTGSGNQATVAGASSGNPIIGRIAFWADDDTAKLNINTAAHGYFWDIPRASSREERDRMSRFQPALREYQRYPGHPATTSLWPALRSQFNSDAAFADFVYDMVPRLAQGGSVGGTTFATAPVTLDNDRLYTSIDEMLFSARNGQRDGVSDLDRSDVERLKFFLTTRSNSPEVNLFNLPRMAIWPVNAGGKSPSTLDELIAFCATINGVPYYLQRADSNSATADIQGFDGRNRNLYNYINSLLGQPFPGFGNSTFASTSKYSTDVPQITTQIFDYIRSANLHSSALGADSYTFAGTGNPGVGSKAGQVVPMVIGDTKGFGRLPTISKAIFQLYISGIRYADGTTFSDTTLTPESLQPYNASADMEARKLLDKFLTPAAGGGGTSKEAYLITRGIIYFDLFDPMLGYTFPRYNFTIDVALSGGWQVTGSNGIPVSLGFPSPVTIRVTRDQTSIYSPDSATLRDVWFGRYLGGHLGPSLAMQNHTYLGGNPAVTASGLSRPYPLVGVPVEIHLPITLTENAGKYELPDANTIAGNVIFSGGELTVELKVDGNTVQELEFEFPGFTKPLPVYMDTSIHADALDTLAQFAVNVDFRNRWVSQPTRNRIYESGSTYYPDIRLVQESDVAVALEPTHGDKRLIAAKSEVPQSDFTPHQWYADSSRRVAADPRAEAFGKDRKVSALRLGLNLGRIIPVNYGNNAWPDIPSRFHGGVETDGDFPPDFDNGTFHMPDDAYVNRADEGSRLDNVGGSGSMANRQFAWYMDAPSHAAYNSETFFSPNKQMPSAVMFGSLPTGVKRDKPWQTLLFRPDPGDHPGAAGVPDYLLLDLFWMPVVEPYAISERFSSNGKVNMNYQIMPFGGYLHRSTGLLGVLQSQELMVIPDTAVGSGDDYNSTTSYKGYTDNTNPTFSSASFRKKLNLNRTNGTLKAFEDLFAQNEIFRSETQVCSLPLIPEGQTWSANFENSFWSSHRLTGDNSREMPYAQLLPRLTTRSNTYTVHFRVQSLKKVAGTDPGAWDETRDQVAAELRGSRTIERYVDPNHAAIPDYPAETTGGANPADLVTLDQFYGWRWIANRVFAP